jgi:hypothetical protein
MDEFIQWKTEVIALSSKQKLEICLKAFINHVVD